MRRAFPLLVVIAVFGIGGIFAAMQFVKGTPSSGPGSSAAGSYQNDGKVDVTRPVQQGNGVVLQTETKKISTDGDPIDNTLNALFATSDEKGKISATPAGTRLLDRVKVENGIATLNLSAEFKALQQGGDTGESLAQNALRKALAQFPNVSRMTVLIDGKPFEGEHSGEWKNIPVRDEQSRE